MTRRVALILGLPTVILVAVVAARQVPVRHDLGAVLDRRDVRGLKALIDEGVDVNALTRIPGPEVWRGPPLWHAVRVQRPEMAKIFLDAGASVDPWVPASGVTPLHLAAELGNPEIVTMLLEAGADPDATDIRGRTPLTIARDAGATELVPLRNQPPTR